MAFFPPSHVQANSGQAAGLTVRPARPADLDSLIALETVSFAIDRLSRRSMRALITAPSARLVVAERAGALLGYVLLLLRRGSRIGRLYSVAVAASEFGRGTGHRLVEAAEKTALESGARTLRLEVRADNARAIALYEGMNYRRIGERPHYYKDGMTALRYEKPLSRDSESRRARLAANKPPVPAESGA